MAKLSDGAPRRSEDADPSSPRLPNHGPKQRPRLSGKDRPTDRTNERASSAPSARGVCVSSPPNRAPTRTTGVLSRATRERRRSESDASRAVVGSTPYYPRTESGADASRDLRRAVVVWLVASLGLLPRRGREIGALRSPRAARRRRRRSPSRVSPRLAASVVARHHPPHLSRRTYVPRASPASASSRSTSRRTRSRRRPPRPDAAAVTRSWCHQERGEGRGGR